MENNNKLIMLWTWITTHFKIWLRGFAILFGIFLIVLLGDILWSFFGNIFYYIDRLQETFGGFTIHIVSTVIVILIPYLIGLVFQKTMDPNYDNNNMLEYYKTKQTMGEVNIEKFDFDGEELYTVHYSHPQADFTNAFMRMARGTTINAKGEIILRAPNKFFFYRELDNNNMYTETFKIKHTRLDPNYDYDYIEKIDGKMILVGQHNGKLLVSSRDGFDTDLAQNAYIYFSTRPNKDRIIETCQKWNITLVFYKVGADVDSVVDYGVDGEYYLTATTTNNYKLETMFDSTYYRHLMMIAHALHFKIPPIYHGKLSDIRQYQNETVNSQGVMCFNEYGNRIKFHTAWWMNEAYTKHRLTECKDSYARLCAIVDLWKGRGLDDVTSELNRDPSVSQELKNEIQNIILLIRQLNQEIIALYNEVYEPRTDMQRVLKQRKIPEVKGKLLYNYHMYNSVIDEHVDTEEVASYIYDIMSNKNVEKVD